MKKQRLMLALSLLLTLAACKQDPIVSKEGTLRAAAEQRNLFRIGSIYNNNIAQNSKDKAQYTQVLGEEFNYLQCEWDMSMEAVWVDRHTYNFAWCDNAADFALAHNMKLHGAHLLWHGNLPDQWDLTALSNAEFEAAMQEYIDTVMTHFRTKYPGLVTEWNVVNEVLDHDGVVHANETRFRPSVFREKLGPDFVRKAFTWAHAADPAAKLYICDYDFLGNAEDNQGKADLLYGLVTELLNDGVPIHGVAEQCHIPIEYNQDMAYYSTIMDKFGSLGLEFQITECTIEINQDGKGKSAEKLQKQADMLAEILKTCMEKPYFTAFSFWGFTDGHTYLGNKEYPVLFDKDYAPKPCYFSAYNALKGG